SARGRAKLGAEREHDSERRNQKMLEARNHVFFSPFRINERVKAISSSRLRWDQPRRWRSAKPRDRSKIVNAADSTGTGRISFRAMASSRHWRMNSSPRQKSLSMASEMRTAREPHRP